MYSNPVFNKLFKRQGYGKGMLEGIPKYDIRINLKENAVFGAVGITGNHIYFCVREGKDFYQGRVEKKNHVSQVVSILKEYEIERGKKITALAIPETNYQKVGTSLWLRLDIVPILYEDDEHVNYGFLKRKCEEIESEFFSDLVRKKRLKKTGEVLAGRFLVNLEAYEKIEGKTKVDKLRRLAQRTKNRNLSIMFINSTLRGGGVSLMRHSLMRVAKELRVDVSWYIADGNHKIFSMTKKKIHDVLQGVYTSRKYALSKEDKKALDKWSLENFKKIRDSLRDKDVVIIDDYQPSGLIPHIKKEFPEIKIIYRSHIQIRTALVKKKGTIQHSLWNYLWENIRQSDCFVSHPLKQFVPYNIEKKKVAYLPATSDSLDGLNKDMEKRIQEYYFDILNEYLVKSGQSPLDPKRPYIVQIARFDPSKGYSDVLRFYKKLRIRLGWKEEKMPQLVLLGNGAKDDPEGEELYTQLHRDLRMKSCEGIAEDIKLIKVPFIDQLLNVVLRNAYIALQLSYNEGFEIKVSEAIWKGVPIVVYDGTGAPLQVEDKKTGFIVKAGKIDEVVDVVYGLFEDPKRRERMSRNAKKVAYKRYTTIDNLIGWLELINKLSGK